LTPFTSTPFLEMSGISKRFGGVHALRGVDLTLQAGEIVALVAPSGTGKSTLLHLAGLLEPPDGGEVLVGGRDAARMSDDQRTAVRRLGIGFVYQFHHLLPEFTALENIVLPQMAASVARKAAEERGRQLLAAFGLTGREEHRPGKLSGGEQQRVAIARALANHPKILLADEPTGNLDTRRTGEIGEILQDLNRQAGLTVVMVTHNPGLARLGGRHIEMRDGLAYETD